MSELARDYRSTARTAWPSYHTDPRPLRDQQIETLNQALNDEVLRHARTRLLNLVLLSLIDRNVEHRIVEHVVTREVIKVRRVRESTRIERTVPTFDYDPTAYVAPSKQRSKIPASVADRDGLAATIRVPVLLQSGAVLDPNGLIARKDGQAAQFPDASWLALCALIGASDFVHPAALNQQLYAGAASGSTIRTAISRARQTLHSVGADGDIEAAPVHGSGWRLLLARKADRS